VEERIESQPVYNGKLFQVYKERVRLPNGNTTTREIVRHPGSVGIVPRQEDGRIVLVRQYRYVTGRELWEIPAGTLDKPGEGIAEGARRELAEEARLSAGKWTTLGSAYLMPGYCDERMTFYLAEDLSPTEGDAELDGSMPAILPRLPLRSLMTSPMLRSGTRTSTSMMGSSSTGLASITAWRMAMAPASLKAMSFPSTAWVDPSSRRTLMSTRGLPVSTPCSIVSRTPLSTDGRKFCGMEPPKILSSQMKPVPRGTGAMSITQWP